jgi:hypothetical protein
MDFKYNLLAVLSVSFKKSVPHVRKKSFYLKFIIRLFDGSKGATRGQARIHGGEGVITPNTHTECDCTCRV